MAYYFNFFSTIIIKYENRRTIYQGDLFKILCHSFLKNNALSYQTTANRVLLNSKTAGMHFHLKLSNVIFKN